MHSISCCVCHVKSIDVENILLQNTRINKIVVSRKIVITCLYCTFWNLKQNIDDMCKENNYSKIYDY